MKVDELINLINNTKGLVSLDEVEDLIFTNEAPTDATTYKVASHMNLQQHRWYSIAVDVYKCDDGFVGVKGGFQCFDEGASLNDVCSFPCFAKPYKEKQTITYIPIDDKLQE